MNIIVIGGSGFIGSHLIKDLLGIKDCKVFNLDIKESKYQHPRLFFIQFDITNPELLDLSFDVSFDLCIHLSALCKEPGYEWNEYFEVNLLGTVNVIGLCEKLGVNEILFTSTMMVYKAEEGKKTEKSLTAPDTAYGISKLLAEKELLHWKNSNKYFRKLKIIRPAVVFGEHENGNFTRLYRSLKRGFFPYVGRSTTIKSNIYVKELTRFVIYLIDAHNQ